MIRTELKSNILDSDEWSKIYNLFTEQAENFYFRWLNGDPTLTPAEEKLAQEYQVEVAGAEDFVEIEEIPEYDLSDAELKCLSGIVERISGAGLANLMSLIAGVTIEIKPEKKDSSKVNHFNTSNVTKFTNDSI